jgi:exonuclease III
MPSIQSTETDPQEPTDNVPLHIENDPNSTNTPNLENVESAQHTPDNIDSKLLKLCHLNVNGWTRANKELRVKILENQGASIICLSETHLACKNTDTEDHSSNYMSTIDFPGFAWFGNNRKNININAPKPSGGVGVLIKNDLFEYYDVQVVDKAVDGILALQLSDKVTHHACVIICAYLPPENSNWGRDAPSFFSHILQLMYMFSEADALFLCGDLNSRTGKLKDYNETIDDVPPRHCCDTVKNMHGDTFIEFLKDSKCCVLNGRLSPENDNFTCLSTKGKSVVDYIVVPHDVFNLCHDFDVQSCESIVQNLGIQDLIAERSRCPDHALLSVTFNMYKCSSDLDRGAQRDLKENGYVEDGMRHKIKRRFDFSAIPDNFLQSNMAQNALIAVIDKLSEALLSQSDLNRTYDTLCNTIHEEMTNTIPYKDITNKEKKQFRNFKPYWTEELSTLWKSMVKSRKEYERYTGNKHTLHKKRLEYKDKRNTFDKRLRQEERKFKRGQMLEIESLESENPTAFWEKVQKLGPRKKNNIPQEIISENGEVKHSLNDVLNKWQGDFSSVYSGPDNEVFDIEFYNAKMIEKMIMEDEQTDPLYVSNESLNKEITLYEILKITKALKSKKAVGVDLIPNEVLKSRHVGSVLLNLFNSCFSKGMLPSKWLQANVLPIPKNLNEDRRNPMNYRGISLLSTISKTYTALLNARIQCYLDKNNKLVDEQNGFRKGRSCTDHIFTITSIIKHRQQRKLSTYCAFVDMKKSF